MKKIILFLVVFTISIFGQQNRLVLAPPVTKLPVISTYNVDTTFIIGTTVQLDVYITPEQGIINLDSVKIENDIISIERDTVAVFGDSLALSLTLDISALGSFSGKVILWGNFIGSPYNVKIDFKVVVPQPLIVSADTLNFGNVNASKSLPIVLQNISESNIGVSSIVCSTPFFSNISSIVIPGGTEEIITINFYALSSNTYNDKLIITHSAGIDTVILKGTWNVAGQSEQWIASAPDGGGWFRDIEVSPLNSNIIARVGDLNGFAISFDKGITWESRNNGMGTYEMADLCFNPLRDGTIYAATISGVFRTYDYGENWERLGDGTLYDAYSYVFADNCAFSAVYVSPADTNYIYAGTGYVHDTDNIKVGSEPRAPSPRIVRSTNGGNSWSGTMPGTYNTGPNYDAVSPTSFGSFVTSQHDPNHVYAASKSGVFFWDGSSWIEKLDKHAKNIIMHPNDSTKLWVVGSYYNQLYGGDAELYYTNNSFASYTNYLESNGGSQITTSSEITDVEITDDGNYLFVSCMQTPIIHKQNLSNGSWTTYSNYVDQSWEGTKTSSTLSIGSNAETVVAVGASGQVWSLINNALYDRTNTTTDNVYWSPRGGGQILSTQSIVVNPLNTKTVIQGVFDNRFIISHDGGNSWKQPTYPSGYKEGFGLEYHPTDTNYVFGWMCYYLTDRPTKMVYSANGGENWSFLNNDLPANAVFKYLTITPNGNAQAIVYYPLGYAMTAYNSASPITFSGNKISNVKYSSYNLEDCLVTGNISISGTSSNNGTFTITDVDNSAHTITVSQTFTSESDNDGFQLSGYEGVYKNSISNFSGNTWNGWSKKNSSFYATKVVYSKSDENIMWFGGKPTTNSRYPLYKSVNGGSSWVGVDDDSIGFVKSVAINPLNPNTVFIAQTDGDRNRANTITTDAGIFRSRDGGLNWQRVLSNSDSDANHSFSSVIYNPNDTNIVFAATNRRALKYDLNVSDGIYMSEDGGDSWQLINNNLTLVNTSELFMDESGTLWRLSNGTGTFRLTSQSFEVIQPTILAFDVAETPSQGSAKITMTVNNHRGTLKIAELGVGLTTSSISYTETMLEVSPNTYEFTLEGLNTSQTYYVRGRFRNELGIWANSAVDSTVWTELTPGSITLTTKGNARDDAHWYATGYNIYGNVSFGHASGAQRHGFFYFDSVTIPSGAIIDSAFITLISSSYASTSGVNVQIKGVKQATPLNFVNNTTANSLPLTIASDIHNALPESSPGTIYKLNVLNSTEELVSNYNYTNGQMAFAILDNGSTSNAYRVVYSNEESGSAPKLIMFFRY